MTLIETLIAMTLLSLLLVIVFGLFRELALLQDLDKKDNKAVFYENYAKLRLYEVFSHLANENNINDSNYLFYTELNDAVSASPSLVFSFNNGINSDPYNSSFVAARLYVDTEKHELRLSNWPLNLHNPHPHMYQEVLLPNVESMQLSFLSVAKEFLRSGAAADIERRGEWQDYWYKNYKEMPVLLQIRLRMVDDPDNTMLYTYALPNHRYVVRFNR